MPPASPAPLLQDRRRPLPWDHRAIAPRVIEYIEDHSADDGTPPSLLVETMIEDYLIERGDLPARIDPARLRHGISATLRRAGYKRRSVRGRAWDRIPD